MWSAVHRLACGRPIGIPRPQTLQVRARIDPAPELRHLADLQAGVLTLEQAGAYGLGRSPVRRLIDTGQWQRLSGGLFLTARGEPPWLALAWGGVLLGGDSARLGGAAAGHLQQERPGVRGRSVGGPPRLGVEDVLLDLGLEATEAEVIGLVTKAVQLAWQVGRFWRCAAGPEFPLAACVAGR